MDSISSMDLLGREKEEKAGDHTESLEATDGSWKKPSSLLIISATTLLFFCLGHRDLPRVDQILKLTLKSLHPIYFPLLAT